MNYDDEDNLVIDDMACAVCPVIERCTILDSDYCGVWHSC